MIPPFINWPGTDGLMTGSMSAWWFPNRPGPWLGPVPIRDEDQPALVLGRGGGGGGGRGGARGGFRGEGESLPCGPGNYGPDCPPPFLGQGAPDCSNYAAAVDQAKAQMDNVQATDDPATINSLFTQLDPLAKAFDAAQANYNQANANYVACLGAGIVQGISRGMGQDFSKKPTPPPCSTGYLPVIDRGVLKCIPASAPSGMTSPGFQQRTFPVKSFYGWTQW